MDDRFRLGVRARKWIEGIKAQFRATPLRTAEPVPEIAEPAFKIM